MCKALLSIPRCGSLLRRFESSGIFGIQAEACRGSSKGKALGYELRRGDAQRALGSRGFSERSAEEENLDSLDVKGAMLGG